MIRALTVSFALLLSSGTPPAKNAKPKQARVVPVSTSSQDQFSPAYDILAERQLLDMVNQTRMQAGLGPLQADDGLTQAARAHAASMASEQQLSHQLDGESSLGQRLAANSSLHLEMTGENVASAPTVEQAEAGLMQSQPHRENLLNAAYNVAGFAVVHSGDKLYIVQDFGRGLPTYSAQTGEDMVAANVNRIRAEASMQPLQRLDGADAQKSACDMARADSLKTPSPSGKYIIRYTSLQLDSVPASAARAIGDPSVHSFAMGSCYARSTTYPNGAYWVMLLLF